MKKVFRGNKCVFKSPPPIQAVTQGENKPPYAQYTSNPQALLRFGKPYKMIKSAPEPPNPTLEGRNKHCLCYD